MISDLNIYLNKVVFDIRLIIKKYLDVKFEYLVSFEIFLVRKFKKVIFFLKENVKIYYFKG